MGTTIHRAEIETIRQTSAHMQVHDLVTWKQKAKILNEIVELVK